MARELRQRAARHKADILIGLVRLATYVLLFALFFGLMSINNWPLRHLSRTLATTLLTWFAMSVAMNHVYGGFDLGKRKSKPVISSMVLSTLITDLVTYLQLQIMNVNAANKRTLTLFDSDFAWLILCMILQIAVIILMTRFGNGLYFRLHPPRKVLLVVAEESQAPAVLRKIGRYRLQWRVKKTVRSDDPELEKHIDAAEAVFLSGLEAQDQMRLLRLCYDRKKDVFCRAVPEDIMLSSSQKVIVDDAPFLHMPTSNMTLTQRIIKRCMDIGISAFVLLLFSPVMAVIALCIRNEDHGPVIFRQKRLTIHGRVFEICKFRTMSVAASGAATQVSAGQDDSRITKTGSWLRKTRLDELPQLWNILKGDMTLVGPRPEMLDNIRRYKAELPSFAYREKMKAGLTGYAQIEGKYNTTPADKLMLDLMYIESFSIWLDIKLLFRTLTVFFKSDSTEGFSADEARK